MVTRRQNLPMVKLSDSWKLKYNVIYNYWWQCTYKQKVHRLTFDPNMTWISTLGYPRLFLVYAVKKGRFWALVTIPLVYYSMYFMFWPLFHLLMTIHYYTYNKKIWNVWQSTWGKRWLTHWASLLRWIWSISEYNLTARDSPKWTLESGPISAFLHFLRIWFDFFRI